MRKPYSTLLDQDLIMRLKIYAARNEVAANDVIEAALTNFITTYIKFDEYRKSQTREELDRHEPV